MATAIQTTDDPGVAQRILQAALELFASKGFAATSTSEIVEAAGVTKPMLYYYFRSKEGLWRAVLTWYLENARVRQSRSLEADLPPVEQLVEFVWSAFTLYCENPDFIRLLHATLHGPGGEAPGVDLSGFTLELRTLFRRAASNACRSGLVREDCEETLARTLMGVVMAWTLSTPKGETVELTRELASSIVHRLLHGFGRCNEER